MTITITKPLALELLTEAVKDKGAEYVYEVPGVGQTGNCVYTDGKGNPSCIVGHALARAGVPIEVLTAIDFGGAVRLSDWEQNEDGVYVDLDEPIEVFVEDGLGDTGIDESDVIYWLKKNDVEIDEPARNLFAAVQHDQDNGKPWGEAVTGAIGTLTNGRI